MAKRSARGHASASDTDEDEFVPLENSVSFTITAPIVLGQLEAEISKALGADNLQMALTGPDDFSQPPSESNPAKLWISPAPSDASAVNAVIADHQGDSSWGIPQVMRDYQAVMEKITADPETNLTTAEKQSLLVGVALRQIPSH